jgi:uncharacterized protein affecting Mg2+/Co2+ transport
LYAVSRSRELPGLTARLERLCHHDGGCSLPADKPHAFVYFITINNASDRTVTLLGRKWVIEQEDGTRAVIEGDKIVGETPRLAPGEAARGAREPRGRSTAATSRGHALVPLGVGAWYLPRL